MKNLYIPWFKDVEIIFPLTLKFYENLLNRVILNMGIKDLEDSNTKIANKHFLLI